MKISRLGRWISWSSIDVIGRLSMQLISTVIFARLLAPDQFGVAALTMSVVSVIAIIATAPFEEALTQKRLVTKQHFRSALAAVLLLAAGLVGVAHGFTYWIADSAPAYEYVALFSFIILAQAPLSIFTALARRHRRFRDIAVGNVTGQMVGTVCGLALAFSGEGVWSLLAVRQTASVVNLLVLASRTQIRIWPRLSMAIRDLSGFAGWHFADRCLESLTSAVFQSLITHHFGLSANGYLNMAMRLVEPVRGAAGSIGHNISMSYFVRTQDEPEKLRSQLSQTMQETALVLIPVFLGLAATGPTLIPILAGPGWDHSSTLVIFLAVAAALTCSTNFIHSALSSKGRADLGFAATGLDMLVLLIALTLGAPLGPIAIGLSLLVAALSEALLAMYLGRRVLELPIGSWLASFVRTFTLGALMALMVSSLSISGWRAPPILLLGSQIGAGICLYALLIWGFNRPVLMRLRARISG